MIDSYRDLIVWHKAMSVVTLIYKITDKFSEQEKYCLTQQIRKSSISIPSNIAEGYGRRSTNDYIRFLQIAVGSLFELSTQIEIAYNLGYFTKENFEKVNNDCNEIDKMLYSLIKKIKTSERS